MWKTNSSFCFKNKVKLKNTIERLCDNLNNLSEEEFNMIDDSKNYFVIRMQDRRIFSLKAKRKTVIK